MAAKTGARTWKSHHCQMAEIRQWLCPEVNPASAQPSMGVLGPGQPQAGGCTGCSADIALQESGLWGPSRDGSTTAPLQTESPPQPPPSSSLPQEGLESDALLGEKNELLRLNPTSGGCKTLWGESLNLG